MYARITSKDATGGHSTVWLEVLSENDKFLFGREVDKEGCILGRKGPDGVEVQRQFLIEKALITKRVPLVMNLKYGELEEDHVVGP